MSTSLGDLIPPPKTPAPQGRRRGPDAPRVRQPDMTKLAQPATPSPAPPTHTPAPPPATSARRAAAAPPQAPVPSADEPMVQIGGRFRVSVFKHLEQFIHEASAHDDVRLSKNDVLEYLLATLPTAGDLARTELVAAIDAWKQTAPRRR